MDLFTKNKTFESQLGEAKTMASANDSDLAA